MRILPATQAQFCTTGAQYTLIYDDTSLGDFRLPWQAQLFIIAHYEWGAESSPDIQSAFSVFPLTGVPISCTRLCPHLLSLGQEVNALSLKRVREHDAPELSEDQCVP